MKGTTIFIRGANNPEFTIRRGGRIATTLREGCYALAMWAAVVLAVWAWWVA